MLGWRLQRGEQSRLSSLLLWTLPWHACHRWKLSQDDVACLAAPVLWSARAPRLSAAPGRQARAGMVKDCSGFPPPPKTQAENGSVADGVGGGGGEH